MAELQEQTLEAARQEEALREEQSNLEKTTGALQEQARDLEQVMPSQTEQSDTDESRDARRQDQLLQQLRTELATERSRRDLTELETEELALKLDDARDAAALVADQEQWTDDAKVEWHQEALVQLYENHRREMRRLRREAAKLERLQHRAQSKRSAQAEDVSALKWSVEQLSHQNEALAGRAGTVTEHVLERERHRCANAEMEEADGALEAALSEELHRQQARIHMLESAALRLGQGREGLKRHRQAQHAEAVRLESRLRTLRAQRDTFGRKSHCAADASGAELVAALVAAKGRVADLHAQAWAACLPGKLRDDAELGQSFRTLCALHGSFRKARILSSCIHSHYVADPMLVVLHTDLPMRWLCHACLASTQLAYAAVCFLGRLRAADVDKYRRMIRNPAVAACAEGEAALDAAFAALLAMLGGTHPGDGERDKELQETLAAISAQGAQLLSLQGVFFKEEELFASWQSACCAVEALRAVCAFALYASDDAGGSRRQKWQNLYERADRLVRWINRSACATADGVGLLEVQPAEVQPQAGSELGAEVPDDGFAGDGDPGQEPGPCLSQHMVDAVLRQVAALDMASASEPGPEQDNEADALDRALGHAEAQLTTLSQALEARRLPDSAAQEPPQPPWACAREAVRSQIEENERKAPTAKSDVEHQLLKVAAALESAEVRLQREQREVREVERKFGAARISAEHFKIAETSVARLQAQAKSGSVQQQTLEQQLQKERVRVEEVEQATTETRRKCRDLEQQLRECERRLEKKLNAQVPAEDVLALRRTCARQSREIAELRLAPTSAPSLPSLSCRSPSRAGAEGLLSCWRGLRETQARLLLEQAGTQLVNLEERDPETASSQQAGRLDALARRSSELKKEVTALLSEVAGSGKDTGSGSTPFAPIALTRFLRSTAEAAKRGPTRRVALPLPADCRGPVTRFPPALPLEADLAQLQSLHGVLL
mmetsp:Transcript_125677/g.367155  ORF Transcript_125677/g.367155 Transcript_125677/m.367155 type:complete len:959 (-) Transcript_125677:192-3068(-)